MIDFKSIKLIIILKLQLLSKTINEILTSKISIDIPYFYSTKF